MPNCDFFAFGSDCVDVVRFVFAQPGWTLYELGSRNDSELREFSTIDSVLAAFDFSAEAALLQLYAREMKGTPHRRRIDFKPGAVPGASFRYSCEGWGLIQLYLEAPRKGWLSASHTNHNSETRAQAWEPTYLDQPDRADDWDWQAVTKMSRRLNRYIRSRGVDKIGSRAVLPAALAGANAGAFKLRGFAPTEERHS